MNVICSLWAENDDNHTSQIALTIAGNLYLNNCLQLFPLCSRTVNSFLATMEVKSFSDVRDIEVQRYYSELQCLKLFLFWVSTTLRAKILHSTKNKTNNQKIMEAWWIYGVQ